MMWMYCIYIYLKNKKILNLKLELLNTVGFLPTLTPLSWLLDLKAWVLFGNFIEKCFDCCLITLEASFQCQFLEVGKRSRQPLQKSFTNSKINK
jgi:hypothetical protein